MPAATPKKYGGPQSIIARHFRCSLERGIRHISSPDNQILVDQINDRAKLKSDRLKPLHARAMDLLDQIGHSRVYWVPRKRNRQADALATAAVNS